MIDIIAEFSSVVGDPLALDDWGCRACDEIARLRERLGPRGLEVVMIDGIGHYVNAKVKAEIERLRTGHPIGEGLKRTQGIMQRGDVDMGRPSCGQGDEWGRHPTDPHYGEPK